MLPLESQVCSLQYAKRLCEMGVKQESLFCWSRTDGFKNWGLALHSSTDKRVGISKYSAFTVAELGAMLPGIIYSDTASGSDKYIHRVKIGDQYQIYILHQNYSKHPHFYSNSDADCLVTMLIYLLENNLIKVEDINK